MNDTCIRWNNIAKKREINVPNIISHQRVFFKNNNLVTIYDIFTVADQNTLDSVLSKPFSVLI